MSFFISDALAEAPAATPGGDAFSWLFLIGMFAVMYFFLIRPQVKRQKEHKSLVSSLSKGDEVQTMGGMMGKIVEMGDNFIKVEIATNVVVTIRKTAIEAVMPKGSLKEL